MRNRKDRRIGGGGDGSWTPGPLIPDQVPKGLGDFSKWDWDPLIICGKATDSTVLKREFDITHTSKQAGMLKSKVREIQLRDHPSYQKIMMAQDEVKTFLIVNHCLMGYGSYVTRQEAQKALPKLHLRTRGARSSVPSEI